MMSAQRVLVTGATGFIGSHLVRRLIEDQYRVGILKREASSVWRIEDLIKKIDVYDVDLEDTHEVQVAFIDFKPDVVFHLATNYAVEHKISEIPIMVETNVLGTVNLLEASKNSPVGLFVNTSSCFVYKQKKSKLRETDELSPLNLYATTKLQAEQACSFYAQNYGLQTVTFRLFPPYGPADNERRLIPFVIKKFLEHQSPDLTTGRQKWDFVNVNDIVDAYLKVLLVPVFENKHEVINIGTGNAVSIREVVALIAKILGSNMKPNWGKIPHRRNEVWFTSADISKAKTLLKWQPEITLKDGIASTVNWYRQYWKGKVKE